MHQPATIKLAAWASAALLALGVASCSSDDAGDPLSTLTDPPTTAAPATSATTSTTTAADTTTQPADTTTAPPTTAPPPETETAVTLSNSAAPMPPEVLEAALVTGERELELLYAPTTPGIDVRIGEVAEVGSPYESALRSRLSQLQADGVQIILSDPSSNQLIVERGSYDGGAEATVQLCEITNDRIVSAADPTVVVGQLWDGRLHVTRTTIQMRRSDDGEWRRVDFGEVEEFEGVDTCPPEP